MEKCYEIAKYLIFTLINPNDIKIKENICWFGYFDAAKNANFSNRKKRFER
jgi:hypothetical protein